MREEKFDSKIMLVPEKDDVKRAKNIGQKCIVKDWPWGSKQKCTMHFSVETKGNKQRFVKQSFFNGKFYKPKKATFTRRVTLIELGGIMGRVEYHDDYSIFDIKLENMKYITASFFGDDAADLADHFFSE